MGIYSEGFDFDLQNSLSPEQVANKLLPDVQIATKGYARGVIEEYYGEIYSHENSLTTAFKFTGVVDIQEKLGYVGVEDRKYEVYISAKCIEDYKYRLMFLEYGIGGYPVTVVLDEDLAMEIDRGNRNYVFIYDNMEQFRNGLIGILTTNKVRQVLQSIIDESIRIEREDN